MKKVLYRILLILLLFWYNLIHGQNTNIEPTIVIIEQLKKIISSNDSLSCNIRFSNSHRGVYLVNSILTIDKNQITINSQIKTMLNEEYNVVHKYSKTSFEQELNIQLKLLQELKKSLELSGNHQEIRVDFDGITQTYKTRKALALMIFFEEGSQLLSSIESLSEKVKFINSKSVRIRKSSYKILDLISNILKKDNAIYEIEAHSSMRGKANQNLIKTQKRAEFIKKELVKRGIDKTRLIPVGYGETRRLWICTTRACDTRNDRIFIKKL